MPPARAVARSLLDGVIFFAGAAAALGLTRFDGGIAFLWIAGALLIGRLSSIPTAQWPAPLIAFAGAVWLASSLFGLGWSAAPAIAAINIVECVTAALWLRRSRIDDGPLQSLAWLGNFVLAVGVVSPLVGAMGGATTAHLAIGAPWLTSFNHWFAAHALGALTFTPVCSLLFRGDVRQWAREAARREKLETVLLLALVAATTLGVFAQSVLPLLFLPLLPIILVTFRVGRIGAAGSVVILAVVGGYCTRLGYGPVALIHIGAGPGMQFLQLYLAATVLTVLPVAADLARRGQLFRALRDSEARYRVLAETSTDIILNLDLDGCIRFVSPSVRQLAGYDPEELLGQPATVLIAPESLANARRAHADALAALGAPVSIEYLGKSRSGETRWVETLSRAIVTEDGEIDGIVSVVRDISARKAREARLAAEALTDPVTGLPNRRAFLAWAEQQAAGSGDGQPRGCIALFDLDHFKQVNDNHGHAAGDQVLKAFAEVARRTLRPDDRIARIGGEEFALLLPDLSVKQAELVCDRLRQAIAATVTRHGGVAIRVTVSGGVAPLNGTPDRALQAADAAMYRAKSAGRDRLALAA